MKTLLKTDKKYANKLKYCRIKKLALPISFAISFAILLAVPFAVFISKRNLQTEKYKYQGQMSLNNTF